MMHITPIAPSTHPHPYTLLVDEEVVSAWVRLVYEVPILLPGCRLADDVNQNASTRSLREIDLQQTFESRAKHMKAFSFDVGLA